MSCEFGSARIHATSSQCLSVSVVRSPFPYKTLADIKQKSVLSVQSVVKNISKRLVYYSEKLMNKSGWNIPDNAF